MNTHALSDTPGKEWQRRVLGVAVLMVWFVFFFIFDAVGRLIGWEILLKSHPVVMFLLTTISGCMTAIGILAWHSRTDGSLFRDFITFSLSIVPAGLGLTAIVSVFANETLQVLFFILIIASWAFALLSHPFTRLAVAAAVGYYFQGIIGLAGGCVAALVFEIYLTAYGSPKFSKLWH